MAKGLLSNAGVYIAGYELSGYSNAAAIEGDTDSFDITTFGTNAFREFGLGVKSVRFSAAGIYDPLNVDAVLNAEWGATDQVLTFLATNVVGGFGYILQGCEAQYSVSGAMNKPGEWSLSGSLSAAPLVRAWCLHRTLTAAATATGAAQHVGAVSATQSIYGALHVFGIAGTSSPTLTVKIQSDDNSGFTSATDRLTFTAKTAIGAEWKTSGPGAITDDYWRASWTISGTNPVFGFVVSFGFI